MTGFSTSSRGYLECLRTGKGWHEPDRADYLGTFRDFGVCERVDSGEIEEVWFFGGPYFGYCESAMAGPRSFFINGEVYRDAPSRRPFAIMGWNYERGVAEMLHNLCHRTESTLARVHGGWKADVLDTPWSRFAAAAAVSVGRAGVGNCHWPPNAERDYDYANPRRVESEAADWLHYPHLAGRKSRVDRESWGGPDYHRNYLRWWFSHLPRAEGQASDGRLHNWWRYVFEFDRFDAAGRPR